MCDFTYINIKPTARVEIPPYFTQQIPLFIPRVAVETSNVYVIY